MTNGDSPYTSTTCADCKYHRCTARVGRNSCIACDGRCSKHVTKKSCSMYTCKDFEQDTFFIELKEDIIRDFH